MKNSGFPQRCQGRRADDRCLKEGMKGEEREETREEMKGNDNIKKSRKNIKRRRIEGKKREKMSQKMEMNS
jgi:hypothetical protein